MLERPVIATTRAELSERKRKAAMTDRATYTLTLRPLLVCELPIAHVSLLHAQLRWVGGRRTTTRRAPRGRAELGR